MTLARTAAVPTLDPGIAWDALVIGGGATGAGLLRDLARRGMRTLLVDRSDLGTGTSGRYHGLLHSGGRYVARDRDAARECIVENRDNASCVGKTFLPLSTSSSATWSAEIEMSFIR